ncbi:MAG: PEP-utilizing enzyme [Pseudonocardiaceae bacterium]
MNRATEMYVRLHQGHLYSTTITDAERTSLESTQAQPFEPTMGQWREVVRPVIEAQLRELANLATQPLEVALRRAAELFEECIMIHHQLLLPARRIVELFLDSTVDRDGQESERKPLPFAVLALLGVNLPVLQEGCRLLATGTSIRDISLTSFLGSVAPDGDGYGVAVGGWLDDPRYGRCMKAFYDRSGVTRAAVERRVRHGRRRRHIAELILASANARSGPTEFGRAISSAREALELTECHGPLMHAVYIHHLRSLVMAQGKRLANTLRRPGDIVHLSQPELAPGCLPSQREIMDRRREFDAACEAPSPPLELRFVEHDGVPVESSPDLTNYSRQTRTWRGLPGSPGLAEGRLVTVRRPSTIDHLTAADVALVPDPGAVWGWVGLGVRALLVEGGQRLSHVATASRELGIPCVLGCEGLGSVVSEGRIVRVDGRRGLVRW